MKGTNVMTMNIWYNDRTKMFVMFYNGKRYERTTPEALTDLVIHNMKEMRLESLYATA